PNSLSDNVARSLSILFLAIPGFWLGMLIVLATLFWFNYKTPLVVVHLWQDPWANLQIIVGPAIVLGLGQGAYIARMARSCLLEVIREDYVRTARAKGLKEALVVMRHALPNALLPVITLSGILMGFVLGGSVAVEQAFGVPGLGRALVVMAITAPLIAPSDPLKTDFRRMANPPDARSFFGTDQVGRDTLSRVIYGARSSLIVAFASVLLGTTVGALWGVASGYLGGRFDL